MVIEITDKCQEDAQIFMSRELWEEIVEFFRMVHTKQSSEAIVFLVGNSDDPYRVIDYYVPTQEATGGDVEQAEDDTFHDFFMKIWEEGTPKSHSSSVRGRCTRMRP